MNPVPDLRDGWGWLFLVTGIGSLANAAWMFVAPGHWYARLPAAVPDFGPLNVHFVRDIACAFATVGVALVWAARSRALRFPLAAVAAVFFGAHALLHVHDTLAGHVDAQHWLLDFPGVYLPALLLVAAAIQSAPPARRPRSDAPPSGVEEQGRRPRSEAQPSGVRHKERRS